MSFCRDFEEEETMFQSVASKMHVRLDWSLKCHCKTHRCAMDFDHSFARYLQRGLTWWL